ncbi:hypothetical protein HHK36_020661 [Tetracentron sinense]|uniref:RNA helicase n=1 Tax=Tetracentron sinense TaxID=13715 RepID=A0A835D8K3_TETSI|nr:hypothetical protein HHK36_020661 [Tetracentron sinense]
MEERSKDNPCESSFGVTNDNEATANPVKERCWDQRESLQGESQCAICGCYREYICDETDDDICSLECKRTLLGRLANSQKPVSLPPPKLLQNLEAAGYDIPTPVQMQAIPAALTGKNLLVSADTGSGKTASFWLPWFLIAQIFILSIPQIRKTISDGVELIIGTPGRLIDLLIKHDVELDEVSVLVLDEVDCMLQRGFRNQVMQIFQALLQPQVLMYSATIPSEVEKMASSMAKDLVLVSAGKPNRPNESVKQVVIWVESKQKKQKLFDILMSKQHFMPPVVVFVGSRLGADLLSEAITVTTGIRALSIHGEKPMKERRETMRLFLVGEVSGIVATGVLGRGVDLLGVRQVIVFDMPNSIKEYVHQIGRASRLGEEGTAIVFVNEENKNLFQELVGALRLSGAAVPRELANSRLKFPSLSGAAVSVDLTRKTHISVPSGRGFANWDQREALPREPYCVIPVCYEEHVMRQVMIFAAWNVNGWASQLKASRGANQDVQEGSALQTVLVVGADAMAGQSTAFWKGWFEAMANGIGLNLILIYAGKSDRKNGIVLILIVLVNEIHCRELLFLRGL